MKLSLSSSPHQRVRRDTGQVMRLVVYAMIPGIVAQAYFFGWGVLIQALLAVISATVFEGIILWLRKRPIELHTNRLLSGSDWLAYCHQYSPYVALVDDSNRGIFCHCGRKASVWWARFQYI